MKFNDQHNRISKLILPQPLTVPTILEEGVVQWQDVTELETTTNLRK